MIATIPVGGSPGSPTLDPSTGDLYVPNSASDNVSVISGLTNRVVASVPVGRGPATAAFDPVNGNLYVPDHAAYGRGGNVSVISGSTKAVIATIPVGAGPETPVFDSANGDLYVCNFNSGNVSVISGLTNSVIATITLGIGTNPAPPTFDPANGDLYVSNTMAGPAVYGTQVSVISGSTNTVVATPAVGTDPATPTLDPANGELYVPNVLSDNISVISGSTNTVIATIPLAPGSAPSTPAYDPLNGELYVPNTNRTNLSVISGSTNSIIATIALGSGAYPWTPTMDPANGDLYVPVGGLFTMNNVSVISGSTNTIVATIPVGIDATTPTYDGQNGDLYVANIGSSDVSVIAGPLPTYPLSFSENGLPAGANWSVSLNGTSKSAASGSSIPFLLSNGTWNYVVGAVAGFSVAPASGSVNVAGGPQARTVNFSVVAAPTELVTFNETGLAPGSFWTIALNGSHQGSYGTTLTFQEIEGTYSYAVGAPPHYTAHPAGGNFNLAVSPLVIQIVFEAGNGWLNGSVNPASASLTVGGSLVSVSGGSFNVSLPPGSYAIVARSPNHAPYFNNVTVTAGQGIHLAISLTGTSGAGAISIALGFAIVAVACGIAGGLAVGYIAGRRLKMGTMARDSG